MQQTSLLLCSRVKNKSNPPHGVDTQPELQGNSTHSNQAHRCLLPTLAHKNYRVKTSFPSPSTQLLLFSQETIKGGQALLPHWGCFGFFFENPNIRSISYVACCVLHVACCMLRVACYMLHVACLYQSPISLLSSPKKQRYFKALIVSSRSCIYMMCHLSMLRLPQL